MAFQMLLHTLGQSHAAKQAAATNRQVEQSGNAAHRQRAGEFFQFIKFSGQITTADEGAYGGAGNHADLDARFIKGAQHADMSPAACGAATEAPVQCVACPRSR